MSTHQFDPLAEAQPLLDDGTSATGNAQYDALPRPLKDLYSFEEWLWLGDTEKANLAQTETEPEF